MQNWTIARRLVVGVAVVLVPLVALSGFVFVKGVGMEMQARALLGNAVPGLYEASKAAADTERGLLLVLRHINTNDAAEKAQIEGEIRQAGEAIDKAWQEYELRMTREEDRRLFRAIDEPKRSFRSIRDNVVLPLSRDNRTAEALGAFKSQLLPAWVKYDAAVNAEVDFNKTLSDALSASIASDIGVTKWGLVVGNLVVLFLGIGGALLIIRSTNEVLLSSVTELNEVSEQVVSASSQLSAASQSLSQGATEQAASLEETSASMEEMASMTGKNSEGAAQAAALMTDADQAVAAANRELNEMVASMAAIAESSGKVSKIIKTIDEIAFQTNILSLNAAVEAARAGEAGMGFAVVADEVRNLAMRSAQAAKDTASLIEESIAKAEQGRAKVDRVASSIAAVTEGASKVKALVAEVTSASQQQAQGIQQVAQAVAQMEQVTQTTAATAEESAAAAEELNAQVETSRQTVTRLAALTGADGRDEVVRVVHRVRSPLTARARSTAAKVAHVKPFNYAKARSDSDTAPVATPAQTPEEAIPLADSGVGDQF